MAAELHVNRRDRESRPAVTERLPTAVPQAPHILGRAGARGIQEPVRQTCRPGDQACRAVGCSRASSPVNASCGTGWWPRGVTQAAMEATGAHRKPVWHVLEPRITPRPANGAQGPTSPVPRPSHRRPTDRGTQRGSAVTHGQGIWQIVSPFAQVNAHPPSAAGVPPAGLEPAAYRLGGGSRSSSPCCPVR